jgi:phosphoglycerol transferase MdoB-like AlkP superfamily enzyme
MFNFHQRMYLLAKLVIFYFLFFFGLRIAFFLVFKGTATVFPQEDLTKALYLGAKFDLRLAFILIIPVWFLGYFHFSDPLQKGRKFWIYFYTFLFIFLSALYLSDFGHYGYLNSRLNGSVFQYLANPVISLQMLWQTYPIIWATLGLIVAACLVKFFFQVVIFNEYRHKNISRVNQFFSYVIFFLCFAGGIYGKVSTFPLRWSEAFFSQNNFISAVALNPVIYLAETYKYSAPIYDKDKVKEFYPLMADYLGVPKEEQNVDTLNFKRKVTSKVKPYFKPNVLVIVMESMAVAKTDLSSNPLTPTPNLKKLAEEGYYFDEYYVPSEGTARSMFGLVSSAADVTGYQTASRNPMVIDQNLVMDYFKDYEKFYFLGGNANWGQIRGVFTNNIQNVHIVEEGQYDAPITDVWGLSDLDLFKETFKKLNQVPSNKSFFAVVQSAGFHRPYTIPKDHGDFEVKNVSEAELVKSGFISNDEYNSMRFSDYSLGKFLELLKNSPLYENTLIVVTGDHGLPDENAEHISLPRKKVEIEKFHVPLVIHNQRLIPESKKDSRIVTEMDLMVTIADLAGVDVEHAALGRDLLDPKFDNSRLAFTYFHYMQPRQYGMYYKNFYYSVKGDKEELFNLDPKKEFKDVSEDFPGMTEYLKNMTHGYYETAKYILYNNKKLDKTSSDPSVPVMSLAPTNATTESR